jgi:hypothetical protein
MNWRRTYNLAMVNIENRFALLQERLNGNVPNESGGYPPQSGGEVPNDNAGLVEGQQGIVQADSGDNDYSPEG